ncbi:MAG: arginase family protein [Bacilli bacterium]|nr:arginase family protein [Bacilli bacterium]
MKTLIIGAGSDLGVHIDGAHIGPVQLASDLQSFYKGDKLSFIQDESILKSRNLSDRRKNEYDIDKFNTSVYKAIVDNYNKEDIFPILLGGDHSVAVASALASAKKYTDIGIIWIDAHGDFNTFDTTITGNIHGLPLAAITGYKNHELRYFHDGNTINPQNAVVVGARSLDPAEKDNLRYAGVTVFTTEDIKTRGVDAVMNEAFEIATKRTKGVHVSFDLDVIDPSLAPGVSVPEFDGLTVEEAMAINKNIVNHFDHVVSYDLVEYNPLRDIDRKTEQIAINLIAQIIKNAEKKDKYGKIDLTQHQAEQYKIKIVPPKEEQTETNPGFKIVPPSEPTPEPTPTETITQPPVETPQPTVEPTQAETPQPTLPQLDRL